ncbi:MAG: flagellar hook-associated protein FlgK [Pseudomonadota bacterium]
MSLLASLSNARSGMSATGVRAQVTSANIANVSTPGYVRRDAVLSQRGSTGVSVSGVQRIQDQVLLQTRRDAQTQSAGSEVTNAVLERALAAFGEPGSETGMFGTLSRFEGDLQTLRSTPESAAAQTIAVDSLKDMTRALNTASGALQAERTQADARLGADIDRLNELSDAVFELNAHIRKTHSSGSDTAVLLDRRDTLIDEMVGYLPLNIGYEDSGAVRVQTDTGLSLVGANVNEIEFQSSARIGALDTTTNAGGRLSIPTLMGQPLAGAGGHALSEGRIAAYLDLRDTQLPTQAAALDDFAFELASAFDALGEPLLLDNGAAVDPLNKTGLSERLGVNPLIDPARGGEPRRLRDGIASVVPGAPGNDVNLTRLTEALVPFADTLSEIVSDSSSAVFRAERIHTGNVAREVTLTETQQQLTAVDLDHELQTLLSIEQAYTANARVIQTISDMFDTLARL